MNSLPSSPKITSRRRLPYSQSPAAPTDCVTAFAAYLASPEAAVQVVGPAAAEEPVAAAAAEDEVGPAVAVQLVVERARVAGVVGNDLVDAAIDRQAVERDRSDD